MTFAEYEFAGPAGEHRGGIRDRTGPTLWVVLHTSEGGEGSASAENLAAFIRSPGTPGVNVASYHEITDTDRVLRVMADEKRCNGAAGANEKGLHLCFPGRAEQTRAQWLDTVSAAYIEQGARAVADWCVKYDIPAIRRGPVDLKADRKGICDHNDVHLAFDLTDHTDVGPGFPWDVFMGRLNELLDSEGEDDVTGQDIIAIAGAVAKVLEPKIAAVANQVWQENLDLDKPPAQQRKAFDYMRSTLDAPTARLLIKQEIAAAVQAANADLIRRVVREELDKTSLGGT